MQETRVMTKARKGSDPLPTEYLVSIEKNKAITVKRERDGRITNEVSFKMGDTAEYDSYNLRYLGIITGITDKTVTIQKTYGRDVKIHRLSLHEFCWRNYNFDLAQANEENAQTSWNL